MFKASCESLSPGRIQKYRVTRRSHPISVGETLELWQCHPDFRTFFIQLLIDCPYVSYRFETPPVTQQTVQQDFEFVLVDSPGLALTPDAKTFASYFAQDTQGEGVISFNNLGGDAVLVVPCPQAPESAYRHLATFMREAPDAQKHGLLELTGQVMQRRISDKPLWLNTAGGGVSWLHIRLDCRPKYYRFQPYKS